MSPIDRLQNVQQALDKVIGRLPEEERLAGGPLYRRLTYLGSGLSTARRQVQDLEWELQDWKRILTEGLGPCARELSERLRKPGV